MIFTRRSLQGRTGQAQDIARRMVHACHRPAVETVCPSTAERFSPTVIRARKRTTARLRALTRLQFHHLTTALSSNISHFFLLRRVYIDEPEIVNRPDNCAE